MNPSRHKDAINCDLFAICDISFAFSVTCILQFSSSVHYITYSELANKRDMCYCLYVCPCL